MATVRGHLLCDVADLMDAAHRLYVHRPTRAQRQEALDTLVNRLPSAPAHQRRTILLQLAVDSLLWAEQFDEADVVRVDTGDAT